MVVATQRSSRLVPFMSQARCRSFLLSTYQSRGAANFSTVNIDAIHDDLQKAMRYLHGNKVVHGSINEDHVLIEKIPDSDLRRAFLMMSGKEIRQTKFETKTEINNDASETTATTLLTEESQLDIEQFLNQDKEQLELLLKRLKADIC